MRKDNRNGGKIGRVIKPLVIFFVMFLIYHIGFGCNVFPTDEETNTLLAPDWYPIVGIVLSAFVAWFFSMKKGEDEGIQAIESEKYSVIIVRKRQVAGSAARHKIYLDGEYAGEVRNGKELSIPVLPGPHSISAKSAFWQEDHLRFFISDFQKTTYIFDELDLKKSNIKLYISVPSCDGADLQVPELAVEPKISPAKNEISPKKIQEVYIAPPDPMDEVRKLERKFEEAYQFSQNRLLNAHDCKRLYQELISSIKIEEYSLMAQERFGQLCSEYKGKFDNPNPMVQVDKMDGPAFEQWCAELLRKSGFTDVRVTPASGDQGVDIIAVKDDIKYAIQCKRYSSDLGNTPVQEVNAGKMMYHCQVGVVMTNQHFTPGARDLATATGTLLWDREKLIWMIKSANQ